MWLHDRTVDGKEGFTWGWASRVAERPAAGTGGCVSRAIATSRLEVSPTLNGGGSCTAESDTWSPTRSLK